MLVFLPGSPQAPLRSWHLRTWLVAATLRTYTLLNSSYDLEGSRALVVYKKSLILERKIYTTSVSIIFRVRNFGLEAVHVTICAMSKAFWRDFK